MATLAENIIQLAARIGAEYKSLRTMVNGNSVDLTGLTTTTKSHLVAAINEVNAGMKSTSHINDLAASNTTVYSSQKTDAQIKSAVDGLVAGAPGALDTLQELAAALADKSDASSITALLADKADKSAVGNTDTDFVAIFESGLAA